MSGCTVPDCDRRHEARGYCNTHYTQWRRTGSPVRQPLVPSACSVEDCTSPARERGYCRKHNARLRRTGSTDGAQRTVAERLAAKVVLSPSGCWLWQGVKTKGGYGQAGSPSSRDRMVYAHRLSYETHVGPIPAGLQIDHLCRVRNCINPAHLEPVTAAENQRRARDARSNA